MNRGTTTELGNEKLWVFLIAAVFMSYAYKSSVLMAVPHSICILNQLMSSALTPIPPGLVSFSFLIFRQDLSIIYCNYPNISATSETWGVLCYLHNLFTCSGRAELSTANCLCQRESRSSFWDGCSLLFYHTSFHVLHTGLFLFIRTEGLAYSL